MDLFVDRSLDNGRALVTAPVGTDSIADVWKLIMCTSSSMPMSNDRMTHKVLLSFPTQAGRRQLAEALAEVLTTGGEFYPVVWPEGGPTDGQLQPFRQAQSAESSAEGQHGPQPGSRPALWKRWFLRLPPVAVVATRRGIAAQLAALEEMLRRERPAIVLLPDDQGIMAYLLAEAARRSQIPSVAMLWAHTLPRHLLEQIQADVIDRMVRQLPFWERGLARWMGWQWPEYARPDSRGRRFVTNPVTRLAALTCGVKPRRIGAGGGLTDVYLVPGQAYREIMLANGDPPEKVLVTGSPLLDVLYQRSHSPETAFLRTKVCRDFRLASSGKVIVVASDYHYRPTTPADQVEQNLEFVVDALLSTDANTQVIVKLHPDWDESTHHLNLNHHAYSDRVAVVKNYDISPLLLTCDLWVCGMLSYTGLQAIAADKPVVAYDFDFAMLGRLAFDQYRQIDGIICTSDRDQFRVAVQQSMSDNVVRQRLARERQRTRAVYMENCQGADERIRTVCRRLIAGFPPATASK